MFYSPTKEFVRFSTYRTAEIKALKDRIQKEKVTQDQIDSTQLRLQRLRKEYENLNQDKVYSQKIQHCELKEVFHNSERAINDLVKEKSLSIKEQAMLRAQFEELEKKRQQLQEKGSEMEEQLREGQTRKDVLVVKKRQMQETIIEWEEEFKRASVDERKAETWKEQVKTADQGLKEKRKSYEDSWNSCQNEKKELTQRLKEEQDAINKLKMKWQASEKDAEMKKMQVNHSKLSQELCDHKMAAFSLAKTHSGQDSWMIEEQTQLLVKFESMMKAVKQEASRLECQEHCYQNKIQSVLSRVNEEEDKKMKLDEGVSVARANLRLLRQKNQALKARLNSIFRNDTQLVSLICSKKVYPNAKPEVCEIVKKSAISPLETKENIILIKKDEKAIISPQAFGEVNRVM